MMARMVWSQQLSGREDMMLCTAAINQAKNSLTKKSGFSPTQWVLGRSIHLPADLTDEGEIARLGAHNSWDLLLQEESTANGRKGSAHQGVQLLRKVRPTRGLFKVGDYVFYYDQSDTTAGPLDWQGVAQVVGHEGSQTVWLARRGILVAVSPEHLAHANEREVEAWTDGYDASFRWSWFPGFAGESEAPPRRLSSGEGQR